MNGPDRDCRIRRWFFASLLFIVVCLTTPAQAGPLRSLRGHVPEVVKHLTPLGRLSGTNELHLTMALPLRNRPALTNFLRQLYDPQRPEYHHYLTPEQFSARFGPTEADYQAVIDFARSNGLAVRATHDSRILLDVGGRTADVEQAFHVTLRTYSHPTEPRQFFAPDTEPSVDAGLPEVEISGLSDYAQLRPLARAKSVPAGGVAAAGSGPSGNFLAKDIQTAYLKNVTLNGAGQMIGLFEADGYYLADITNYEHLAGLPNVPLTNVHIDGFNGAPGANNFEVALDIEMAMSLAPGLSGIVVFEAPNNPNDWIDILDSMASSNQIKQFSSAWGYVGGTDPNTAFDTEFQKMAAQGQTFLQSSGDGDAWDNPIIVPSDSPYVTSVGGTQLTMTGSGAAYASETAWNSGNLGVGNAWSPNGNGWWGSGGGISTVYSIPTWQQSVSMASNAGSTNMRNIPDVALPADNIWIVYNNGLSSGFMGTSLSAPLWAGLVALANQQAAGAGNAPVGFINPALYAIGLGTNYSACFNDITNGNNTNAQSHNLYQARPGYDLCTGWGSPIGLGLINALAPLDILLISPPLGFVATGGFGGPFDTNYQIYTLTNTGGSNLNWALGADSAWLSVSPSNGTLIPGGPAATVTVSLNTVASNEAIGTYSSSVWFTNVTDGVVQNRSYVLNVIAPPSFTSLPGNQSVFSGAAITLSAAATGGTPLSYQWQLSGTNLTDGGSINGSKTGTLTLSNVSSVSAGSYSVIASNLASTVTSTPPALLTVVPSPQLITNGGFETGNFGGWTSSGNFSGQNFVVSGLAYAHSGHYGAELGSSPTLGYLSQTFATTPGQIYGVSMWFDNPAPGGTPNQFTVTWNGNALYSVTNTTSLGWTNLQFTVPATGTNAILQIGFRDDPAFLGLDDVSVLPLRANLQSAALSGGIVSFTWIGLPNADYQVQFTTDLTQSNWLNVGAPMPATNPIMTAIDTNTNSQTFYRVLLVP